MMQLRSMDKNVMTELKTMLKKNLHSWLIFWKTLWAKCIEAQGS